MDSYYPSKLQGCLLGGACLSLPTPPRKGDILSLGCLPDLTSCWVGSPCISLPGHCPDVGTMRAVCLIHLSLCPQLPVPCFSEAQPLMGHFPSRSCQVLCPHHEGAELSARGDHRGLVCRQGRYFLGSMPGASQNQRPEPSQERDQKPRAAWWLRTQADPPWVSRPLPQGRPARPRACCCPH